MTTPSAAAAPSPAAALRSTPDRLAVFDTLKAVASQLIVLHHLVAYGPLAEAFRSRFPRLADWLYYDGRLAVQVFFVIGGFLAARALAPALQPRPLSLPAVLWKRYRRLALPCMAAVLISIACAAIARSLIDDPSLPATPSPGQLLAHALLLQDIVGVEALSAGVWYVAIDFQLYAMAALLVWLASRTGAARDALVLAAITAGVAATSLFVINRDTGWDVAGPYYFGVYALGAAVCWLSGPGRSPLWGVAVAAAVVLALTIDHRERVAFAGCVALLLWGGLRSGLLARWPDIPVLAFLGRISFSVFLIHYPVAMLVNAVVTRLWGATPDSAPPALAFAWAASVAAGALFHRQVEQRCAG
jgi:peptidoglycan/LPS O-acetylase OafA/YrhL